MRSFIFQYITMKGKRLTREFFNRPTLKIARELLGKFLIRKIRRKIITAMITETEAYCGSNDLASHASRGRTPRTEVMFGPPGYAYVYLVYGMYHCLNVVAEKENYPAAVLIRGVIIVQNLKCKIQNPNPKFKNLQLLTPYHKLFTNLNGPGKLCRYFQIDRRLNKEDLIISKNLWLEDRGVKVKPNHIRSSSRIGVDYAGPYKNKPWRFFLDI